MLPLDHLYAISVIKYIKSVLTKINVGMAMIKIKNPRLWLIIYVTYVYKTFEINTTLMLPLVNKKSQ
jgi:hypothetical protein